MPAEKVGVKFTDAAARKLVDDLRRINIQRPDGSTEEQLGLYIEPVQLQVVCQWIWEQLPDQAYVITEDDVKAVGDVDSALGRYYTQRVYSIAQAMGVGVRTIR